MKPKQRRYNPKPKPKQPDDVPYTMLLGIEALHIVQASFQSMEQVLKRSGTAPKWRLDFAVETFNSVKQKVGDMLLAPGNTVEFDYNELLIIRACLQIYTIDLLCMQRTPERSKRIEQCYEVANLLPLVVPTPLQLHD